MADSKHQAADVLSRLDTNGKVASPLDDYLLVFSIGSQCGGEITVSRKEAYHPLDHEELNKRFVCSILEISKLSSRQADNLESVSSIRDFLDAEKNDEEYCRATDAVGVPNC